MKLFTLAALALTSLALFAEPVSVSKQCPVCRGKRSLSLTPPNLGQYDGEIGVTPGKPFTSHRFDVKLPQCPICDGTGRQETYKTRVPAPPAEEVEDREKCVECRWSGVSTCKKCIGTGLQSCRDCKSSSQGGKPGWIKTKQKTGGATSRHFKIIVSPCTTCRGIGKVVCPECLGKGAVPCRKCKGEGSLPKKEKK